MKYLRAWPYDGSANGGSTDYAPHCTVRCVIVDLPKCTFSEHAFSHTQIGKLLHGKGCEQIGSSEGNRKITWGVARPQA